MNARSWVNNQADFIIMAMQSCVDINKEPTSIKTKGNTLYVYRSAVRRLYKSF
jgi:hypothetical protein